MTNGFTLVERKEVPVLQATVHHFRHTTGAELLHFECADNVLHFAAIIPTVPTNETGEPHILEHCVLAGSKHYPDARSLGAVHVTGGGAWTGWEYTWYMAESPSRPDFLKLIDFKCDQLFEPLLDEETFLHQAHHLEFENPDDPSTPLVIRGVIFNEQKGIFTFPLNVSWIELSRALFPGLPYALEHGGTTTDVPKITYDDLKAFHDRFYHPANAKLITWGDIPVDDVLAAADAALSRVPSRPFSPTPFPRLEQTPQQRRVAKLPVAAGADTTGRAMVLLGWVVGAATEPYDLLRYDVIAELLLGSPTAPLRQTLAKFGTVAETYDRYGVRYHDLLFACGVQDVDPQIADDLEKAVVETLAGMARDGFDPDAVDAAVHRVEFRWRTLASAHPQGGEGDPMSFFIQHLNTGWVCGADPLRLLDLDAVLKRLARERSTGRPIEDAIRGGLVDNPHRAVVVLEPDPGADVRADESERARLDELRAGLTEADEREIVATAARLREYQASKAVAPVVPDAARLRDAATTVADPARLDAAGVAVDAYTTRTNGITYVDVFADIGDLPGELWEALDLFGRAIVRAGAEGRTGDEMAAFVGTRTGGLESSVLVPVTARGDEHLRLLRIGGRALERHQDDLLAILSSLLAGAEFTPELVRGVIDTALPHAEQLVPIDAPGRLRRLAGSRLRRSWGLRDRLDGFGQLEYLRRVSAKESIDEVIANLDAIRAHVAHRGRLEVFVAASGSEAIDALHVPLEKALSTLPGGGVRTGAVDDLVNERVVHEARTQGMTSAFNCEVLRTPGRGHPDAAAIAVGGSLASRWVRQAVAQKGTAYNATTDYYSDGGSLVHWSIRDPNIARTYEAFAESIRRLRDEDASDDDLGLARFEVLVTSDMPQAPAVRARRAFVDARLGLNAQTFRERVAATTAADVSRAAREHLTEGGARATLSSAELIAKARAEGAAFEVSKEL